MDRNCVNALLQAFAFPQESSLLWKLKKCVNALLQAFAFPLKTTTLSNIYCVNALLQAFAFPQYPFKNPLFMRVCEPVFAGIYLTILIISVFCYFLGFF